MFDRVEVDQDDLRRLVTALRKEADGKELARDLVANLRKVAEPAAAAARTAILSMPGNGGLLPGLRQTIAAKTRVSVRASGRRPGVSVRVSKSGMPRDFHNAPKRLNARRGWKHMVFGDPDNVVWQRGLPDWFDGTMPRFQSAAEHAAAEALDDVAKRISSRTRG